MSVKLLTEHHLRFLSLKGDCTGSSESTLVKMPYRWKLRVMAHIYRGSDISAYVLLNLLNRLGKRDNMQGLLSILSLFRNKFNKFNDTGA